MVKKTKATRPPADAVPLPVPERETPTPIDDGAREEVAQALAARVGAVASGVSVAFDGVIGPGAALAVAVCGDDDRAVEVFVFVRAPAGHDDDGVAFDVAVDLLDVVVTDVAAAFVRGDNDGPPLDWRPRRVDGFDTFVRGELRRYALEEEAARLLGEPPLPRALPLSAMPRLND